MTGDETADIAPPSFKEGISHAAKTLAVIWRTAPGLTLIIAVVTIVVALLPAAAAYMSKLVVDGVLAAIESGASTDQRAALTWVAIEAGLIASLLAGKRMLLFFKSRLHAELGYGVTRMILDKSLSLSLAQIEDPLVQQQLVLARQHAANRPYNLVNRIFTGMQSLLTLLSIAALLLSFSPWLILLVIAGGVPLFIGDLYFAGTAFRFYTGRTPQMRERSYLESLMTSDSLAQERLHYHTGPEIRRRYTTLFDWLYGKDRTLQARRAWAQTALSLVSSGVFLGGKVWIVLATIATTITLGQMTMLVGLLKQGQSAVTALLAAFNGIVEDILYVSNLYAMLDLPTACSESDTTAGPSPNSGIKLDAVSFTYPGQNRPALRDISFEIPAGARVGIVGANGSGKTTLVKLLTGLYQPHTGTVSLDGLALGKWNRQSLTRRMGVMFQPFNRYKLSARDNIAVGDAFQTSDDKRLLEAADRGLAGDLVRDLPQGLDTRLSKRFLGGLELSGGQWQRLSMARAYLNESADILILDEPTAAMDPLAEAKFMQQDRAGKTSILISHRLSNIRHADLILVLDEGQLVEQGTHEALIAKDGLYARLFNTQASAYRSND
jgi:ATP-binding cassette subfamily B protein